MACVVHAGAAKQHTIQLLQRVRQERQKKGLARAPAATCSAAPLLSHPLHFVRNALELDMEMAPAAQPPQQLEGDGAHAAHGSSNNHGMGMQQHMPVHVSLGAPAAGMAQPPQLPLQPQLLAEVPPLQRQQPDAYTLGAQSSSGMQDVVMLHATQPSAPPPAQPSAAAVVQTSPDALPLPPSNARAWSSLPQVGRSVVARSSAKDHAALLKESLPVNEDNPIEVAWWSDLYWQQAHEKPAGSGRNWKCDFQRMSMEWNMRVDKQNKDYDDAICQGSAASATPTPRAAYKTPLQLCQHEKKLVERENRLASYARVKAMHASEPPAPILPPPMHVGLTLQGQPGASALAAGAANASAWQPASVLDAAAGMAPILAVEQFPMTPMQQLPAEADANNATILHPVAAPFFDAGLNAGLHVGTNQMSPTPQLHAATAVDPGSMQQAGVLSFAPAFGPTPSTWPSLATPSCSAVAASGAGSLLSARAGKQLPARAENGFYPAPGNHFSQCSKLKYYIRRRGETSKEGTLPRKGEK